MLPVPDRRLRDPRTTLQALPGRYLDGLDEEDAIALALLPANQRYFAEVPERDCRIALITLLLRAEVLPRLGNGPAGHPTGLNLHWTFGRYVKHTE